MRKSYYATSNTIITSTITGNANGEITLSMTAANTANLTPGRQVFDLLITSPAQVKTRVIEGVIVISPGVTQIMAVNARVNTGSNIGQVKLTQQTRSTIAAQNFAPKPNVALTELTDMNVAGVQTSK
jgi:hypothetical protein